MANTYTTFAILVVVLGLSAVYLPSIWVSFFLLLDFYTPWALFKSGLFDKYHEFLVNRLPERPEQPLTEMPLSEANLANIIKVSKGFTWPVIIRGMLGNESTSEGIRHWKDPSWWLQNYADETVLCGTLFRVVENCTIRTFFEELEQGRAFYVTGASRIVDRHPQLHDMIDNHLIRSIEPSERTATQLFLGLPQMGTDIHCAVGINIFRQVVGAKKWWFVPPSQTAYLKSSINVNGFSSHTHTMVGKEDDQASPWLSKLERYTATLHPGDVLINPPWFWHGVINLGDRSRQELVIGSATRYRYSFTTNLRTNALLSLNMLVVIVRRYGLMNILQKGFKAVNLQGDIANDRRDREGKKLVNE